MSVDTWAVAPSDASWTAEQIVAWMDSFRELILDTVEGDGGYDRLRKADPMRQVSSRVEVA